MTRGGYLQQCKQEVMAMPNPPGVSVSQIAIQLEAFDQMRLELVSFPDTADGGLSQPVCRGSVVWTVNSTTARTACSEIIRIYPGRGGLFQFCTVKRQKRLLPQLHRWAGNHHFLAIC